jgi:sigma-B regulation protein RsbU (phosphoserine phosphatase)
MNAENQCYWLVGLDGRARKHRVPIEGPILIGRGAHNHVVLDDVRLSRQHARVSPEMDRYVVYDLNSTNGTYVNDSQVSRHVLSPNDVIRVGPYGFRVELGPMPERASSDPREFEPPTLRSLDSMSSIAAAPDSKDSIAQAAAVGLTELEEAYAHLETLYGFMQAISHTIEERALLELMSEKIRDVYPIAMSVGIYLRNRRAADTEPFRLAHSFGTESGGGPPTLPEEVTLAVLEEQEAFLVADSQRVRRSGSGMCAPMIDRGETLGLILVNADTRFGTFSPRDLDLFRSMATPAAIMLNNTRMHEASLVRDRLKHDLELAARIQKSFLPREVVTVEGLELVAEYRAAYTVGGDFYDVFWVAPGRLAIFIGDISGKGVAASLLMARISSELRVSALAHIEPRRVMQMMNRATLGRQQPELFFTAIYMTIDVSNGNVRLANAGHPPPYWSRADGRLEPVTAGASGAIGLLDDMQFAETEFFLSHGDSLVLYTDGVVEAADADRVLYGAQRLEECLKAAGRRPADITAQIVQSVTGHVAEGRLNDDLTLFVCQRAVGRPPTLQPRRDTGKLATITPQAIDLRRNANKKK